MDLLNNPWIIGIGGGILSGLVVAYMSRLIFSKRDSREYAQKISQANHEILYAVRPGISEGVIPSNSVLRSLVSATARKYSVDVSDMHDLHAIATELIKEVMDSSFISATAKRDFCEKLAEIKEVVPTAERLEGDRAYDISARYRRQIVAMLTGMVTVLTATAGFMVATRRDTLLDDPKAILLLLLPAAVAILMSFAVVFVRELQKMRIESLSVRLFGLGAELKKRDNEKNNDS